MRAPAPSIFILFCFFSVPVCAGDPCCDRCGCQMACKLVKTTRTISTICYGYKCETICIPGPSRKCSDHCESVGDGCACGKSPFCNLNWTEWIPGCAKPYNRKTLVKYVAQKEVPAYKWVYVPACGCDAGATQIDADAVFPSPPQPVADAAWIP